MDLEALPEAGTTSMSIHARISKVMTTRTPVSATKVETSALETMATIETIETRARSAHTIIRKMTHHAEVEEV